MPGNATWPSYTKQRPGTIGAIAVNSLPATRSASGPLRRTMPRAPGPGAEARATMVSLGSGSMAALKSSSAGGTPQPAQTAGHREQQAKQAEQAEVDEWVHFRDDDPAHLVTAFT